MHCFVLRMSVCLSVSVCMCVYFMAVLHAHNLRNVDDIVSQESKMGQHPS